LPDKFLEVFPGQFSGPRLNLEIDFNSATANLKLLTSYGKTPKLNPLIAPGTKTNLSLYFRFLISNSSGA